jgi:hypothetical protein
VYKAHKTHRKSAPLFPYFLSFVICQLKWKKSQKITSSTTCISASLEGNPEDELDFFPPPPADKKAGNPLLPNYWNSRSLVTSGNLAWSELDLLFSLWSESFVLSLSSELINGSLGFVIYLRIFLPVFVWREKEKVVHLLFLWEGLLEFNLI